MTDIRAWQRPFPLLLPDDGAWDGASVDCELLGEASLPGAQPLPQLLQRAPLPGQSRPGGHQHHHRQEGHHVRRLGPHQPLPLPLPADRLLLLHDDPRHSVLPGEEDHVQRRQRPRQSQESLGIKQPSPRSA